MYRIKIYKTLENEKLKKHWQEIYSKNNYCPQSSYEWISIWWKYFSKKSRKLFIVTVEENNAIIGIGPFMIEKNFFLKELKFIGTGLTDFHEFLVVHGREESTLSIILNYILNKNNYDIINLEQIADNSRLFHILKKNSQFKKREMIKCPIVNFNSSTWEKYFKYFSRNFRRDWTKKYNRLSREGKLQLIKLKTIKDKMECLGKMFKLHIKRWESKDYASKLSQENIRKFISRLVLEIPEISIYILLYNNEIISYRLGFTKRGVYYAWNSSYDEKYHSYSIGIILLGLIIKDLIENNYQKINFMRGNYNYKRRWMTDEETLTNYQFLAKLNALKGYFGEKYYLNWKWWIKIKFNNIFERALVQKILIKRRH